MGNNSGDNAGIGAKTLSVDADAVRVAGDRYAQSAQELAASATTTDGFAFDGGCAGRNYREHGVQVRAGTEALAKSLMSWASASQACGTSLGVSAAAFLAQDSAAARNFAGNQP